MVIYSFLVSFIIYAHLVNYHNFLLSLGVAIMTGAIVDMGLRLLPKEK